MKKSSLIPLFSIVFVDMLGFGFIIPIIPFIALNYGLNPFMIGILLSTYPFGQAIGAAVIGRLSDRFGRKPLLLLSITGTFLSLLLLGFSRTVVLIFVSRLLDGLTGGNISVAQSYITDLTDEQNRAKGLGLIGAAFGLGFIFGPAIGGYLSQFGYQVPAFFSAGLAFINIFLVIFMLPESLTKEHMAELKNNPKAKFSLKVLLETLKEPIVGPLLHSRVYYALAFAIFQTIFALYVQKKLNLDAKSAGFILAYVGVLVVFVQGVIIGPITKKYSEKRLMIVSSAVLAIGFLGWALSPSLVFLLIVLIPISFSSGVLNTVLRSALTKSVAKEKIGGILGLSTSLESITSIIAPLLGGFLMGNVGLYAPGIFSFVIMIMLTIFMKRKISNA